MSNKRFYKNVHSIPECTPVIEMLNKMIQETMFRTTMQNSHKYTSLKVAEHSFQEPMPNSP